jgi:hypothetical protein
MSTHKFGLDHAPAAVNAALGPVFPVKPQGPDLLGFAPYLPQMV